MKKISILSLTLICSLGLIFPYPGLFSQSVKSLAEAQETAVNTSTQILVKVIMPAVSSQAITVSQNSGKLLSVGCQVQAGESANFVQNAGAINLNQPASCFNLSISQPVLSYQKLSVTPRELAAQKVMVVDNKIKISSPNFIPSVPASGLPLLPATVYFVLLLGFISRRKIMQNFQRGVNSIKISATPYGFQVLRC